MLKKQASFNVNFVMITSRFISLSLWSSLSKQYATHMKVYSLRNNNFNYLAKCMLPATYPFCKMNVSFLNATQMFEARLIQNRNKYVWPFMKKKMDFFSLLRKLPTKIIVTHEEELCAHSTRAITELKGKLNIENCQGYITITPKQSLPLERSNPYLILFGQRSNLQNLLMQSLHNWRN